MSTTSERAKINLPMKELAKQLVRDYGAVALAAVVLIVLIYLATRQARHRWTIHALIIGGGVAVIAAAGFFWLYKSTFTCDLDECPTETVSTVEGIWVELNYPVSIFENTLIKTPTALELGPNNELYVSTIDGNIWRLTDTNLDGVADPLTLDANGDKLRDDAFLTISGLNQPEGMAWGNDGLFVNERGRTIFLQDSDGNGTFDKTTVIVDGFPGERYAFHQNNSLVFGDDGRLYIGSGSTTDHSPEVDPLSAIILSVNPDGSDLQIYATGLRNPYGMVPAPGGGFFVLDNGASGCMNDDCSIMVDVPEELNYIVKGHDYGFPKYFGMPPEDSGSMPPMTTFPAHAAPTGLEMYDGNKFPERFKGQLFAALWARNEIYRVQPHRIDDEHFVGAALLFSTGIPGPSAIINSPDGGLYIASFSGNAVFHIG